MQRSRVSSWIAEHYRAEIAKAKGIAIGAMGAMIREMLVSAAAPPLRKQLEELVNDFTGKLGGSVIEEPILKTETSAHESTAEVAVPNSR